MLTLRGTGLVLARRLHLESRTRIPKGYFTEMKIDARILARIPWKVATEIQAEGIPSLLIGRSVVASGRAGTGKTAMYAIPLLNRMLLAKEAPIEDTDEAKQKRKPSGISPKALIMVPGSELAHQISRVFKELSPSADLFRIHTLTSETKFDDQVKDLPKSIDILVTTPGRLKQHMISDTSPLNIDSIEYFVMDETDKLLHLSLYPEVKHILNILGKAKAEHANNVNEARGIKNCQIIFVSATMLPAYRHLIRRLIPNRLKLEFNTAMTIPANIKQIVYSLELQKNKPKLLAHLIKADAIGSGCMVFVSSVARAKMLQDYLKEQGIVADMLESKMSIKQKRDALDRFRNNETSTLISTELLSRGIDLPNVKTVVNFDVPICPEDYIHRVGRCGRAGIPGTAITLMAKQPEIVTVRTNLKAVLHDTRLINNIEKFLLDHDSSKSEKPFLLPCTQNVPGDFQEMPDMPLEVIHAPDPRVKLNSTSTEQLPYFEDLSHKLLIDDAKKKGMVFERLPRSNKKIHPDAMNKANSRDVRLKTEAKFKDKEKTKLAQYTRNNRAHHNC